MPRNYVVVGAGVLGVCVAARLAEAGADVTLLEQAQPGHAATRSSFAWLNSNNKTPRAYHDLNYAGMRAWAELARSAGPPGSGASPSAGGSPSAGASPSADGSSPSADGSSPSAGTFPSADGSSHADGSGHPAWYRPNGNLEWADSAEGHAELTARVRRLTEWGYPATLVGAVAAAELEPSLRLPPSVTEVAWFPEEGYLLTGPLVAQMATARGAAVLTGAAARVVGIDADGGSVHAVRTATGQVIPADIVVCCAGRWAPQVAALAGSACPVPLVPWSSPGAEAPGLVVQAGPVSGLARMVHAPEVYLRPHSDGLVHLEAPDVAVDLHTPDVKLRAGAAELLRRARLVIRGLDDAEVAGYRVCVRPMPADGQSIVGWLPGANGVYVAVTHSGVTLGAHLARLITAEVTSGAPAAQLAPYRPARFAPSGSRR
jgi:glycine/D-amino acid oxidase-like deaminating enzyme